MSLSAAINALVVGGDGLYVDGSAERMVSRAPTHRNWPTWSRWPTAWCRRSGLHTLPRYVASLDIALQPDHGMELLRALHLGGRDADVVRLLTDEFVPGVGCDHQGGRHIHLGDLDSE